MNRPFYAFGALLTALALAMLAVSSTSRSTSVSSTLPAAANGKHAAQLEVRAARTLRTLPAAANGKHAAQLEVRAARTLRFSGILVVLPAEQDDLSVAGAATPNEDVLFWTGCDWDRSRAGLDLPVGNDWSDWDCRDVCPLAAYPSAPPAALVETNPAVTLATHDPARLRDETSRDCRSHYDPAYDVLVYGEIDCPISSQRPPVVSGIDESRSQSAAAAPVEWSDYAVLIDEALSTRAIESPSAESTISVRSSGLLVDFAASALNRTGLLLQSAAQELRRVAQPENNAQLAGESPSSQR